MFGSPSSRLSVIIVSTARIASGLVSVLLVPSSDRTEPPDCARNWVSVCIDQVSSWYIGSLMKFLIQLPFSSL